MEKDKSFYDEVYASGGSRAMYLLRPEKSAYYPVWEKLLPMVTGSEKIIELGCGPGQLANILIRAGKNYQRGFDFSKVAISMAKNLNPENSLLFDEANILELLNYPPDATYIICEVLEHMDKDLELLSKLPGGAKVIFSVPNYMSASHVRCFDSYKSIMERYGKILSIHDWVEIPLKHKTNTIHLVKAFRI
jgi:2-polyprenyl-3-methyl-5-hydroxy-6-metoxy-1,4-benzoquinol methylase